MIKVGDSTCICGKCKEIFLIEWELDVVCVSERGMGEEVEYESKIECECPACGNVISGTLYVCEYPVGALNMKKIRDIWDSEETGETKIKEPVVAFFDI